MNNRIKIWLGILFLCVAILGAQGFKDQEREAQRIKLELEAQGIKQPDQHKTWPTALFASVQLFFMNTGADIEGDVPLRLEAARWMALLLCGIVVIGIFFELAEDFRHRFLLRFFVRRHTVIVGLGVKGRNLAGDLRHCRKPVVGIDKDPVAVAAARSLGIVSLCGEVMRPEDLESTGIRHAHRAVFLMTNGEANVLAALETSIRHPRLKCHAHVPSFAERNLLYRQNVLAGRDITLFNIFERMARLILARYPVEALSSGTPEQVRPGLGLLGVEISVEFQPWVFVLAGTGFTDALCAAIARTVRLPLGGGRNWTHARVSLVGDHAQAAFDRITGLFPRIQECMTLDVLEQAHGESTAAAISRTVEDLPETPVTVFLDMQDSSLAFSEALAVADRWSARDSFPRRRCIFDFAGSEAIRCVVGQDPRLSGSLLPLPNLSECCEAGSLFDDQRDNLAKVVHQNYGGIPPWSELTAELRESNRAAADHIGTVLRAVGLKPEDVLAPGFAWDEEMIESLARCEHQRWSAQKWMDGWQPAPELGERQDKDRKRHGCLGKAYDELSEEMKERDRDTVRIIPELLRLLAD